jgi:hypothetical protein
MARRFYSGRVILAGFILSMGLLMLGTSRVAASGGGCTELFKYSWGVSFTYDLSPDYWAAGNHTYDFEMTASANPPFIVSMSFDVTSSAPLYSGEVDLRIPSPLMITGPVTAINLAEDMRFQVTWKLADDQDESAAMRAGLAVHVRWAGGAWVRIAPGPLMRRCVVSPDHPDHFHH